MNLACVSGTFLKAFKCSYSYMILIFLKKTKHEFLNFVVEEKTLRNKEDVMTKKQIKRNKKTKTKTHNPAFTKIISDCL